MHLNPILLTTMDQTNSDAVNPCPSCSPTYPIFNIGSSPQSLLSMSVVNIDPCFSPLDLHIALPEASKVVHIIQLIDLHHINPRLLTRLLLLSFPPLHPQNVFK